MGKIIEFAPRQTAATPHTTWQQQDAYFHFLQDVVITAQACGFRPPRAAGLTAEHLYANTHQRSRLAKLLAARTG